MNICGCNNRKICIIYFFILRGVLYGRVLSIRMGMASIFDKEDPILTMVLY